MIWGAFSHKKELNIQIFPHSNSHIIWGKKFRLGATQQTLLSVFSKNIQPFCLVLTNKITEGASVKKIWMVEHTYWDENYYYKA